MPGGVSSPVRAFGAVGGSPRFIRRGRGAIVEDVEGRDYVDLVMSWGALILGHSHPEVVEAVRRQADLGTSFGAPSVPELELAETICRLVPSIERVRLVSSGTEAVMSAVRLARAATGRRRLLKFAGAYHGHYDPLLAEGGSGLATLGLAPTAEETLVAPYNDLQAARTALAGCDVAALLVEPVAANMGVVPPAAGFLAGLREACDETGTLLVFDEVITGFRLGLGGAQAVFGVRPDLTVLGKIIGGGLPVGAYGGRTDLMTMVAPEGPVYQAGTLAGNPLAVAAGIAMLRALRDGSVFRKLEALGARLAEGTLRNLRELGGSAVHVGIGSLSCLYFLPSEPRSWDEVKGADTHRFAAYFHEMLRRGIYLAPSQFEASFLSAAHTEEDIDRLLDAQRGALERVFGEGK